MTPDQRRAQEPTAPLGWSPNPKNEAKRQRRIEAEIYRAIKAEVRCDEVWAIVDLIASGEIPHVKIDYDE